jgi:hypothetical protein
MDRAGFRRRRDVLDASSVMGPQGKRAPVGGTGSGQRGGRARAIVVDPDEPP